MEQIKVTFSKSKRTFNRRRLRMIVAIIYSITSSTANQMSFVINLSNKCQSISLDSTPFSLAPPWRSGIVRWLPFQRPGFDSLAWHFLWRNSVSYSTFLSYIKLFRNQLQKWLFTTIRSDRPPSWLCPGHHFRLHLENKNLLGTLLHFQLVFNELR